MKYNGNINGATTAIKLKLQDNINKDIMDASVFDDILDDNCDETIDIHTIPDSNYVHTLIYEYFDGIEKNDVHKIYDQLAEELRMEKYFSRAEIENFKQNTKVHATGTIFSFSSSLSPKLQKKSYVLAVYSIDDGEFQVITSENNELSLYSYPEVSSQNTNNNQLKVKFEDGGEIILKLIKGPE